MTAPLTSTWPSLFASATDDGLWIPNGSEGAPPAVARLDPVSMEITATVDLGGELGVFPPDAWATASSANGVWVALAYQKAVVLIDPATNTISRRIEVNATPYSLVEDGDDLWIADWENSQVLRIDIPSGEERIRVGGIVEPTEIAIGPEGLWVNEHSRTSLVRLDPETGEKLARVAVGGRPGVALGLGGVWALSNDLQTVSRIDPATNAVVATIPMPSSPQDLAISGDSVWATVGPQRGGCERTSSVVRIDPASDEPDGIMNLPCAFGLISHGGRLWASTYSGDVGSIVSIDAE